jgi:hypothetical protein
VDKNGPDPRRVLLKLSGLMVVLELLKTNFTDHAQRVPEDLQEDGVLLDLLVSDKLQYIERKLEVLSVQGGEQLEEVRELRQADFQLLRFLFKGLGQAVKQHQEETVVVASTSGSGTTLPCLAVGLEHHLVVNAVLLGHVLDEHVLIVEFVKHQWKHQLDTFALDQQKTVDQIQESVELDADELPRTELALLIPRHQTHKIMTNLLKLGLVRHNQRPVVPVYFLKDVNGEETAGIVIAHQTNQTLPVVSRRLLDQLVVLEQSVEKKDLPVKTLPLLQLLLRAEVDVAVYAVSQNFLDAQLERQGLEGPSNPLEAEARL